MNINHVVTAMSSISGEIVTKYDHLEIWQDCDGKKPGPQKIMWNAHRVNRTQKKTKMKDESRVCSAYVWWI